MKWVRMGWGPEFSTHFSKEKNFHVDFKNALYTDRPIIEIAKDAIKKISVEYPAPYTLMLSGGIDSQVMLWCWVKSQVPFNAVSVRYVDDSGNVLNIHDISNLEKVANHYSVSIEYIDFNIIQFLENHLEEYATKYQCTSPQITTYMCMSEMIHNGTVLFSGDFLATAFYNYTIYGLKRYADMSNRNIIPFFLLHDPELTTVLSREYKKTLPTSKKSMHYHDYRQQAYLDKVKAIQKIGITIFPQESKYSGFEKIKDVYDKRYDLITTKDRIKFSNKPSKRLFDMMFRYKLTDIVKYVDVIIYRNW